MEAKEDGEGEEEEEDETAGGRMRSDRWSATG